MRVSVKRVLSGCALVMAFVPGVTFAAEVDESAGPRLEEVTVTATRHEEAISKVPISVSAYTQESMDEKGIRDFADIARYTPGVKIDGGQTNAISIRGRAGGRDRPLYHDPTQPHEGIER
jgi:outer membrane receptor for ferrienterochelin and colicin